MSTFLLFIYLLHRPLYNADFHETIIQTAKQHKCCQEKCNHIGHIDDTMIFCIEISACGHTDTNNKKYKCQNEENICASPSIIRSDR